MAKAKKKKISRPKKHLTVPGFAGYRSVSQALGLRRRLEGMLEQLDNPNLPSLVFVNSAQGILDLAVKLVVDEATSVLQDKRFVFQIQGNDFHPKSAGGSLNSVADLYLNHAGAFRDEPCPHNKKR